METYIQRKIEDIVTGGIGYREFAGDYSESLKENIPYEKLLIHLGILDAITSESQFEKDSILEKVLSLSHSLKIFPKREEPRQTEKQNIPREAQL